MLEDLLGPPMRQPVNSVNSWNLQVLYLNVFSRLIVQTMPKNITQSLFLLQLLKWLKITISTNPTLTLCQAPL